MYPGPWAMNRPGQMTFRMENDHPEWFRRLTVEAIPKLIFSDTIIEDWGSQAVDFGFTQGELDNFIAWQPRWTFRAC